MLDYNPTHYISLTLCMTQLLMIPSILVPSVLLLIFPLLLSSYTLLCHSSLAFLFMDPLSPSCCNGLVLTVTVCTVHQPSVTFTFYPVICR